MKRKIDWAALIEDWRRSGLSQSAYCRQNKVALSSFNTKLRQEEKVDETKPCFIEIPKHDEGCIEILVNERLLVRLPSTTAAHRLSEVVRCLS